MRERDRCGTCRFWRAMATSGIQQHGDKCFALALTTGDAPGKCHRYAPRGDYFAHVTANNWCGDYLPVQTYVMLDGEDGREPRP